MLVEVIFASSVNMFYSHSGASSGFSIYRSCVDLSATGKLPDRHKNSLRTEPNTVASTACFPPFCAVAVLLDLPLVSTDKSHKRSFPLWCGFSVIKFTDGIYSQRHELIYPLRCAFAVVRSTDLDAPIVFRPIPPRYVPSRKP